MTKDMGFLDLALVLAKQRKLVIIFTLLAAIGAIIYAMLAPFYWKSTATIIPVSDSDAIGGFSTNLLDMVGGGMIKTQKSEQAVDFISVMQSRTFREKVIEEFDLIPYFKIKKPYEHARELALWKLQNNLIRLIYDQESYIITISAETKDKSMSREIVEFYLRELESYNQDNRMSKGRMKREFLETQVAKHMADVDSLAKALRDFQTKNKSVALDQQTEAMVSMYGEIVAQYMQTDIEYELAKNQYSESSPIVQELAAKKALLSGKVKELENSNTTLTPDYLIQIDKIPDLSMQLAMLMVNVEIKKQIIEYLYPQFELAKLEELKDMPSFQIIDAPREAGMRSKPKRAILVVIITLAAFIFACVLALIVNGLQHNSGKVNQIWKTFWGKA
ncbi:MAG: Wzz/FepE/Etk N-terminal domain-containing protein [Candidatus Cloacimonetes bacterium]|jgi:uncharacterized protein involved in exopolysaccharide biosynthesis|nr:hypothetical protein [Candidatus Cloacimonadota bacterium]MDY0336562.1 Wzz/FepE/Etk N-terminal domain-containing protein [Candidatus Cloacimonadaceae bacterium]MCB5270202.1 hypothetical protein [Candidatus Cloacimonadota bacterium]MCK9334087.1 Wzz/FepE/Etk N-terminal domain-containing protein [Candidatus Cloacimonadota bacterium]MDD2543192.1 Wzz/FepE/Etk N-terminal domain-containing protein [Candidatus Cloacimonadota bacterium]